MPLLYNRGMSIEEKAKRMRDNEPQLRVGQSLMIVLWQEMPMVFQMITQTELDCFSDDSKVGAFLQYMKDGENERGTKDLGNGIARRVLAKKCSGYTNNESVWWVDIYSNG